MSDERQASAMKELRRALDRANEIARWDHGRSPEAVWSDFGALVSNLSRARAALAELEVSLSSSPLAPTQEGA